MDLGSDGLAAAHAMMYAERLKLNSGIFGDPAHGSNCDLKGNLRAVFLYQFWLLMMVSWNLPFGCDNDRSRYRQLVECMKAHFKRRPRPEDDPMFLSLEATITKLYQLSDRLPGVQNGQSEREALY